LFLVLFFIAKKISRLFFKKIMSFKQAALLVSVPKYEVVEGSEKIQPKTQEELAEKIAVMESFFSNIAGLSAQKGIKYEFTGRTDHLSFEIVLKEGLIYFYVVVPANWKDFLEQQIMAQFPKALVEEVEDYNIFSPQGVIGGSMLKFKKEYLYPIKTYRKLETDSLNALTGALSKLDKNSGAAIQVVVRSANPSWHKWGRKTASIAHQGKKVKKRKKGQKKKNLINYLL
ncbi:MAG: hypothetical protein NT116_00880, partial [Candidatus Parcubacteria bacterium]|nr:hypothetical protein [Candidatus Parcubacteria bacterium]